VPICIVADEKISCMKDDVKRFAVRVYPILESF